MIVMTDREADRLLTLSARTARDEWGRGWDGLGPRIQKALIAEGYLYLAYVQNVHHVSNAAVRRLIETAWDRLEEEFNA